MYRQTTGRHTDMQTGKPVGRNQIIRGENAAMLSLHTKYNSYQKVNPHFVSLVNMYYFYDVDGKYLKYKFLLLSVIRKGE